MVEEKMTKLKYFLFILIISALHYSSMSYGSAIDAESKFDHYQCLRKFQAFSKKKISSVSNENVDGIRVLFFQEHPECRELLQSEAAGENFLEHGFAEYIKEKEIDNGNLSALSKTLENFVSHAHKDYEYLFKEPLVSSELLNCFVEGWGEGCKYSPATGYILNAASLNTITYLFSNYYNPEFHPSPGFLAFSAIPAFLSAAWWSNKNLKILMLGVLVYRTRLIGSGDYYHLQSTEKIQNLILISILVNNVAQNLIKNSLSWSYVARTHPEKLIAGVCMLALYIQQLRIPESRLLILGTSSERLVVTAVGALGWSFFQALKDGISSGQYQAFSYELSEKMHLVIYYGGAVLASMISTGDFPGEAIASLMIITAFICRFYYNLRQPIMEPGEDFNPAPVFLLNTLTQLLILFQ